MRTAHLPMFFVFAWASEAQAQPTWEYYYNGVGTAKGNMFELASGNIFGGILNQSAVALLDPAGNVLHTHCYDIDPILVVQAVKRYSDNEFDFASDD